MLSFVAQYADGRTVSKTLKNTAEVVSFFDDLFDSVNGSVTFSKKCKGKQLRSAVTPKSKHIAFWQAAIKKLGKMKFIDHYGREKTVPSLKNWICTLQSMQRLWQFLREKGINIFRPRYINSDAIENFFGKLRAYNYRNNNPTCHNFVQTFKSLLITGFIKFHHTSFNCENDEANSLLIYKSLFSKQKEQEKTCGETNESFEKYSVSQDARRERLTIQSRAYTAGWVIRKILNRVNCKDCRSNLTVNESSEVHKWISHREFKQYTQKKLTYPAEPIVRYFGTIFDETKLYLEQKPHIPNLSQNIEDSIKKKCSFEHISCQNHKDEVIHALLNISIRLCIHNWCSIINKILKGTDVIRLESRNNLPEMQRKALNKYKKKFKRNK